MSFVIFFVSAALVIYAGYKLSVYGDVVADKSGLGQSFIGLTLVAFFTSLPELISTIGAITVVDAPDMAFGNVYGSNMFNMLVVFAMDLSLRSSKNIYAGVTGSNRLAGMFAVYIMIATMPAYLIKMPTLGWINPMSIVIALLYFLATYSIYRASTVDNVSEYEDSDDDGAETQSLKKAYLMFMIFAAIIVVSGLMMSKSAENIATITGLGTTFVGSFLLAIVTSLPELATCLAAVKIGANNMAIGSLFGSNVFNMVIIPVADAVYRKGDIFSYTQDKHLVSAIFASLACMTVLIGIRDEKGTRSKIFALSPHSYVLLFLYVTYTAYMFAVR